MWKRFNKTDRRILSIAAILLLLFSCLLYDDSLLFPDSQTSSLKKIGSISVSDRDVRRKVSKQFVWKSAKGNDNVYMGDSLFTGQSSKAKIKMDDGRELTVGENSLVSFANVDGQFVFDLQFGKMEGEIKGANCIKVLVQGKMTEICGENAKLELDADGSVNVLNGKADVKSNNAKIVKPKTDIQWKVAPLEKFYHNKHHRPMNLAWTTADIYGRYHIQFSKQKDFKSISFEQIVQSKEAQLKNYPSKGLYYVRIQGDDLKGVVSSFSSVKTTEIATTETPEIITPLDKQTLTFKVNADGDLTEPNRASVSWNYSRENAKIEMQIASDADFNSVEITQTITGKAALTPALAEGVYHVRVRDPELQNGLERPWSNVVEFNVKFESPAKLKAPVLLTTDIKYFGPDTEPPKVRWSKVSGANKYVVEVSKDTQFVEKHTYTTDDVSRFDYKDYYPGDFYVRVLAATEKGTTGAASNVGTLLVRAKRPVLNPVEPKIVMGKTPEDPGDPVDINVTWSQQKFADSYVVEVSKDPQFKEKTQFQARTPASIVPVEKPGDYFWRVQGLDSKGLPITNFSETGQMNYTLRVPLATPSLLEPLNNMTLFFQKRLDPYFWIEWGSVRQANNYKLELSTTESFENVVFSKDVKTTRFLVKDQLPQGALFWRVRAEGEGERLSHWSQPRKMFIYSGRRAGGNQ